MPRQLIFLRFIPLLILFIILPAHAQMLPGAQPTQSERRPLTGPTIDLDQEPQREPAPERQIICAGNLPPDDMVITATGNSVDCGGSCRGRRMEPVLSAVMVICAQQPIPEDYDLQSVTSTPACYCLGEDENAYVIRRKSTVPTSTPTPSMMPSYPNMPGSLPGAVPQGFPAPRSR